MVEHVQERVHEPVLNCGCVIMVEHVQERVHEYS